MQRQSHPFSAAPTSALALTVALLSSCAPPPAQKLDGVPVVVETHVQAATLAGFSDTVVLSGRTNPVAVRFASNGKVFIAEENGRIYFHDSLSDSSATLFADLRSEVNSYWDRGMLGFALDPNYATNGFMYVLYTHDTASNGENNQSVANRNGTDSCPSPPGGTSQGCVTYGRISRLTDPGSGYPINVANRLDLITEWPQQFPSHAIGSLVFGPDGQLYATAGDGASFGAQDYGNFGLPKNPLGDPPAGVGGTMTSPTSRGGSLRSQSFRRPAGENVTLNGTIIRVNPATGAASSGNPNASHPDADAKRIIAYGLRNPYRFSFHPTSGDVWFADVGGNEYEEINRLPAPITATPMKNFGWPCFEGSPANGAWSGFNLCSGVTHTAPYYAYAHDEPTYSGDSCDTGGSAITGVVFYPQTGGNYPATYRNAMFYSDLPRNCIWYATAGANGLPTMSTRKTFIVDASHPVDLQIGPNNDLFYVDYGGTGGTGTNAGTGTVRRVRYQAPTAISTANPTSGFTPLVVNFTGSMSTPGIAGDTLTYAWDLDGDGQYDDSTAQNPSRTYNTPGSFVTRLKVTDQRGGFGESQPITITAGSTTTPPQPTINTPLASLTWKVGDSIAFSGSATDAEDGTIPASGLTWDVIMQHCPNACHEHLVQSFDGVASGSFPAPDHEYPSYLTLRLTATDSHGVSTTVSRDLMPQTVVLSFTTAPSPGLTLSFNLETAVAPFTRTVIKGSFNGLTANNQVLGSNSYTFLSWSDGGGQAHDITANADASYTATFSVAANPWVSQDVGAVAAAGSWSESGGVHTVAGNGADIWTTADEFRFTHQQLAGDGTIVARVTNFTNNAGNANGKAGVMMRQSLAAGSTHIMMATPPVTTATVLKVIRRNTVNVAAVAENGTANTFPRWVRLVRTGTSVVASHSTNGTTWTTLGTPHTGMTGTIYVGLAVSSHVDGTNATATFDNVSITAPPPPGPPSAPSGLAASGGVNQATLNWTDNSNNETGFKVERKLATDPDTSFAQVGSTTAAGATSFTNTGVPAGNYAYRVKATNANGDSAPTNTANATVTAPPPPAAPSGLTVNGGVSQAQLGWTDNSNNETGFKIERKLAADPDTSFAQVGTTGANVTSFTNSPVAGGVYSYRVRATNAVGDSGYTSSVDATITDPPPPSAPSGLVASDGVGQVSMTWVDNANNETGFKVERKLAADPDTSFAQVGTTGANITAFTNSPVAAGVYSYRVRATNMVGDSGYSNSDDATVTDPTVPDAPSDLTATGGVAQASLSWVDNASDETGFKIERKLAADPDTSFAQVGTAAANATTFTNTSVPAGTYSYRVRATNGVGDSGYSNSDNAVVTVPSGPAAPSNLGATTANGNSAVLTWTDNSSNETGFRVEKKVGAGAYATLTTKAANVVTHTDGSLAAGTYTYRVVATGSPDSAASNEVVVIIANPEADVFVRGGVNANTNYNSTATTSLIEVKSNASPADNNRNGYVRFPLAGVKPTVTSAKLRIYGLAVTTAKNIGVYQVSVNSWVETTVTWNTAPVMGTLIQQVSVGLTAAYLEYDVTAWVQAQKTAGVTAVSLGLKAPTNSTDGQTKFNARENSANKPILIISSK